jgi:hypothetical protein
MTSTKPAPENFAQLLDLLKSAGVDAETVEKILSDADKEREATAEANKVLEQKMYPEDERDANFQTLDSVREAFFSFAATVSHSIVVTPGDPNRGNKNTRSDRRQIEIPTPYGTLNVRLVHN